MAPGCQCDLWPAVSCNEVTAGSTDAHLNTYVDTQQTEVIPLVLIPTACICDMCVSPGVCLCVSAVGGALAVGVFKCEAYG